jgi:hypothetical protein
MIRKIPVCSFQAPRHRDPERWKPSGGTTISRSSRRGPAIAGGSSSGRPAAVERAAPLHVLAMRISGPRAQRFWSAGGQQIQDSSACGRRKHRNRSHRLDALIRLANLIPSGLYPSR